MAKPWHCQDSTQFLLSRSDVHVVIIRVLHLFRLFAKVNSNHWIQPVACRRNPLFSNKHEFFYEDATSPINIFTTFRQWARILIFMSSAYALFIPANSHALGVRLTQSPQIKNESAWDFCPYFHSFIYTIIDTSIAPKTKSRALPTLGLAGLAL